MNKKESDDDNTYEEELESLENTLTIDSFGNDVDNFEQLRQEASGLLKEIAHSSKDEALVEQVTHVLVQKTIAYMLSYFTHKQLLLEKEMQRDWDEDKVDFREFEKRVI